MTAFVLLVVGAERVCLKSITGFIEHHELVFVVEWGVRIHSLGAERFQQYSS